jgi:hypothetical protein
MIVASGSSSVTAFAGCILAPSAAEVAALQAEADARAASGQAAQAALLSSLVAKLRAALDGREKSRIDPDLEALCGCSVR